MEADTATFAQRGGVPSPRLLTPLFSNASYLVHVQHNGIEQGRSIAVALGGVCALLTAHECLLPPPSAPSIAAAAFASALKRCSTNPADDDDNTPFAIRCLDAALEVADSTQLARIRALAKSVHATLAALRRVSDAAAPEHARTLKEQLSLERGCAASLRKALLSATDVAEDEERDVWLSTLLDSYESRASANLDCLLRMEQRVEHAESLARQVLDLTRNKTIECIVLAKVTSLSLIPFAAVSGLFHSNLPNISKDGASSITAFYWLNAAGVLSSIAILAAFLVVGHHTRLLHFFIHDAPTRILTKGAAKDAGDDVIDVPIHPPSPSAVVPVRDWRAWLGSVSDEASPLPPPAAAQPHSAPSQPFELRALEIVIDDALDRLEAHVAAMPPPSPVSDMAELKQSASALAALSDRCCALEAELGRIADDDSEVLDLCISARLLPGGLGDSAAIGHAIFANALLDASLSRIGRIRRSLAAREAAVCGAHSQLNTQLSVARNKMLQILLLIWTATAAVRR
jgi:hypothetical protein